MKQSLKVKRLLLTISIATITLISCRKEKTSWDSNWSAPLIHGSLTINDLIPQEYTATNMDGYLSLVYHDTAYSFSIDTLLDLPDTSVQSVINVGQFSDITVEPGFAFTDDYGSDYDLGQIELKQVILGQGTAIMKVISPWAGQSLMTIEFPLIDEMGSPFSRTYPVPAGSQSDPVTVSGEVDMTGFDMDLRGLLGIAYNEVPANFIVVSDEETNSFVVTAADTVLIDVAFTDLVPRYAKGYFGQYELTDTVGFSLAPMKKIIDGTLDIDSVDIRVTVRNGFNLIAQSTITKLSGINTRTLNEVDLTFDQLGNPINLNPASGGLWSTVPSDYPIEINNLNSNVTEFIENLADSMSLGYSLFINPDGNVTAGSDELYPSSSLDLYVDAEFPLNFSANDLTLVDTFEISYDGVESVSPQNGEVRMTYTNGFPLEAGATFYLLDENDVILDSIFSTSPILSGSYDEVSYLTTASSGTVFYSVLGSTVENLELAKKLMLKVSFSTDEGGKIKIDANSFFDFNVKTNLQLTARI